MTNDISTSRLVRNYTWLLLNPHSDKQTVTSHVTAREVILVVPIESVVFRNGIEKVEYGLDSSTLGQALWY
ncbi:hypothetical protein C5167_048305 [Papaver somniferum]|uniref:Uncharacterized protein n=1 Tax=Papaver somniferum TaxID=3469 RepID=A0A4Y7KL50_PAPSO|nr:hypothetical protein C5167_048305 [Papaver somniferum]